MKKFLCRLLKFCNTKIAIIMIKIITWIENLESKKKKNLTNDFKKIEK